MEKKIIRINTISLTVLWLFAITILLTPASHAITYTYDNLNRLTKAQYKSGLLIEYEYDAGGNILSVRTTEPDRELSVTPAFQKVPEETGITTFTISNTGTDPMNWTATVDENDTWLTITSRNSGINNGMITVRYEANPDDSRIGRIIVKAPGAKGSPQTVEIRQGTVDRDGDGVADDEDIFPDDPNEWSDNDKDATGDNADKDDDNDLMPDEWENQYETPDSFVDDASEDGDQDGYSNMEEYLAHTNPDDPDSYPVTVEFKTKTQSVTENAGTVSVTVLMSDKSKSEVTVPYTVSGTATGGGTDHNLADGIITIPAGQTSGTVSFAVVQDDVSEAEETVIITMGTPTNAQAGPVTVHTVTIARNTPFEFIAGVFTAGDSGKVGVEWLYDGGMYEGEFGVFSMFGMEAYLSDMEAFIKEAVRRARSNSVQGHIVFSDPTEGARFNGALGEPHDWNSGTYNGEKFFKMRPKDQFAAILIPNAAFQDVYDDPGTDDPEERPLFSLASSNPEHGMYLGQIVDINGMGHAFVYEDILFSDSSDRDYNDFIFQVSGARGDAPLLDDWINSAKDWRKSDLGSLIVKYVDESEASLQKTVTFIAGENGTLFGTLSQTVERGNNCTPVTAVPNTGYRFKEWSGDQTGTANPLAINNVTGDIYIIATFDVAVYPVTFNSGTNGNLSGETNQTVKHGDSCTPVTALPAEGYHFTHWSGDYEGTENPLTLTGITKAMNVTANFEINEYSVSFHAGENGNLDGESSQTVKHGDSCKSITAVPADAYHFTHWSGDYEGAENPLALTGITKAMNVTATFEINEYAVSFHAGDNGNLTGEISQTMKHGGNCTAVTAVPAEGYHFTHWSGDYEGTENPLTITGATKAMNVTANFEVNQYTVTFTSGDNGTLVGETSQAVKHGENALPVTAEPKEGYRFAGWAGDHTGTENPLLIENVTKDCTVQAAFGELGEYSISTHVEGYGTIEPSGIVSVKEGEDQRVTIRPGSDLIKISNVIVDNISVSDDLETDDSGLIFYEFKAVSEDHRLKVTFRHSADLNGSGTVDLPDAVLGLKISAENAETPDTDAGLEQIIYVLQTVSDF